MYRHVRIASPTTLHWWLMWPLWLLACSVQAGLLDLFDGDSLVDGNRYAFIPSLEQPAVAVIDTYEKRLASVLELKQIPAQVIVSDKLNRLVISHREGHLVTLLDLQSRMIEKQLDIGMRADAMLLNPYDRYVAFGSRDGSVSVWDLRNYQQMLRVDGLGSAENLTFGVDGRNLYVIDGPGQRISVVEMHARAKVAEIPLGAGGDRPSEISGLSRSADGYTGYLSITSENRVVVIDLISWELKQSISVGESPVRPYSTADNRYILVPHRQGKSLTVLSAMTHQIVATIATQVPAREINSGWLDTVAFIMPDSGSDVAVIDLRTLTRSGVIRLSGPTDNGFVSSDSKMLFAGIPSSGEVVAIDARNQTLVGTIATPLAQIEGIEIAVSNNICH